MEGEPVEGGACEFISLTNQHRKQTWSGEQEEEKEEAGESAITQKEQKRREDSKNQKKSNCWLDLGD